MELRNRGDSVLEDLDAEARANMEGFSQEKANGEAEQIAELREDTPKDYVSNASDRNESDRVSESSAPPPDPDAGSASTQMALPTVEEVINQKGKKSTVISDVFIQQQKSFRRAKREQFESMMAPTVVRPIAGKLRAAHAAYSLQSSFHNISLILQGFLSGLTTAHTVFAFNFADEELLLKGYRWMSLPVHATFYVCFLLGTVSAFDRLEQRGVGWEGVKRLLQLRQGALGLCTWLLGATLSILTIRFDEDLALATIDAATRITPQHLLFWRALSLGRSLCALVAWLLLAMQPNSNELREKLFGYTLPEEQRTD